MNLADGTQATGSAQINASDLGPALASQFALMGDAQVTPDDLKAWIDENGEIPPGACVAMHSGWAAHVDGDRFRGADESGTQHYPGFHVEAAQMQAELDEVI